MLLSPAPWEPTVMYQVLSITTSVSIVTLGTTVPLWLVGLPRGPAGEGTTVQVLPKPPYNTSLTQVSTQLLLLSVRINKGKRTVQVMLILS